MRRLLYSGSVMKMVSNMHSVFRRAVVAGLMAQVLALLVLAVSPGLHKCLHQEADQGDHSCAITLFASGGADVPAGVVGMTGAALLVVGRASIQFSPTSVATIFEQLGIWEHAPPARA
jgi:hypothetical protein